MTRQLALTLDLDGPHEYAALHGLDAGGDPLIMYRAPLERFCALCQSLGGRGTVFAVGRDVRNEAAERLRAIAADGFEVGCHSAAHDYRLSRRDRATIRNDLASARHALEAEAGVSPAGFRAPGYNLSRELLDEIEEQGFSYDSSVLASPPYYVAKAAVLSAYRLIGRRSAALLGSPRLALAPRSPYRPGDDPYEHGGRRIIELPIAVATPLGLPVTGASVTLAWPALRRAMTRALARRNAVVINLHAMELVDPKTDGLPKELAARQPELRMPLDERDAALRAFLTTIASQREIVTCATMAEAHASDAAGAANAARPSGS
jgi:peptidoglycan/xylan/chitin deacetylase (PgdA/CDA1 family)